ncbi:50S ribosomal protein L2 [Candidatus Woesearchaeota archaeon]|nr:MAG: 50S ribosomal protein L2 [Candidatus Woesearchaeota archaeon]
MGKNLIQQARGKGTPRYRAPSFNYFGAAKINFKQESAKVVDLVFCRGHSAPLAKLQFPNKEEGLIIASDGMKVGNIIYFGQHAQPLTGNTLLLKDIPEGSLVYNIEGIPGDGGRYVRASGGFAKVSIKTENQVMIIFPSKKQKTFHPLCKATMGIAAGGGRKEKPIMKAGNMYHRMRARNKRYPEISGSAQNAVDHPMGNKRTSRKSKAKPVSRNAPPGRKVGYIAARRTGQKK